MGSIYNLAVLLKSMKKFEEAEELFREELAACNSPSMLSMFFSLRRCYDSWKMAALLLFSEFSAETGLAKADHVMENTTKRPCLPGGIWRSFSRTSHPAATVLDIFRRLEVKVSRNPTSAGARKSERSAGTSASGRLNCSVKAGREGVRDIHKSPDRLLMVVKQLHVWRRGVGSDVWNLRCITRTFAPQAVSVDRTQRTKGFQPGSR